MAAASESNDEDSVKGVFEQGFLLHCQIENDEAPSNSDAFQEKVSAAVNHFVRATEMVNSLGLFSSNEELSEVPTSELRYFLLPAFLGDLFLRQMAPDRLTVLNIAKVYFVDFLKRCKNYGVTDIELQDILSETTKTIQDEDTQRNYYVLLLKFWVNKIVEHLTSLHSEMEILEHMKTIRKDKEHSQMGDNQPSTKTFKPILITREMTKAKVFGAGYPSVPTMTQEEFLEKEILEGKVVLDFENSQTQDKSHKSDVESDGEDDPAKLKKQRDWDEWKDDHRRGWGNRENMG
ncbi:immunoglobulin-binding protein 1-like isoform X2 [Montipora foliosa]|uniref:immunoglobulin-binding protein 1-like isoform X2 n=1 Tax=Montipora foliosa TaxID=591990 RepID=UPI0035F20234